MGARMEMELADMRYKATFSLVDKIKAQLNGLQSVNKHLDVT